MTLRLVDATDDHRAEALAAATRILDENNMGAEYDTPLLRNLLAQAWLDGQQVGLQFALGKL